MKLEDLVRLQRELHGPGRLAQSLGDGFLYRNNPFFRRIRTATLARGFRYTLSDPGGYFAFPLAALDVLFETRRVPYRDNLCAIRRLVRARPGFFELRDLNANRPMPNYVLHESAHAVAFHELFGRPKSVRRALTAPAALLGIELGEAYAMTAEYFAACAATPGLHRWLFSVNSYRQRTPARQAVGELVRRSGLELVAFTVLLAFLSNLFFVERLAPRAIDAMLELWLASGERTRRGRARVPDAAARHLLRKALSELMTMNPEFRRDTTRIFLTMFGRSRDVERVLRGDPLEVLARDRAALAACRRLVGVLARDARCGA